MEDSKINLNREQAVELHNVINVMSGGASYKLLRANVQEKVVELWPEIKESSPSDPSQEVRLLSVTSREQKAIAEGLVGLILKKDTSGQETLTGAEFNYLRGISKICKISKWLNTKISQEEVPEFEEDLDDQVAFQEDE